MLVSRHRTLLSLALLATPVLAGDPLPPPGGFPIVEFLARGHSYYDGYKTRMDLRLPDPAKVTPPATGWPCILLVHGGGGGRQNMKGRAIHYAKLGYIGIAYDVRGQGDSAKLNPGTGLDARDFRIQEDMAEILHAAKALLGSKMDLSRVGVTGGSQGGYHSWNAAAWSERVLPVPRGAIKKFPKILAVAPQAASGLISLGRGPAFNAHRVSRLANQSASFVTDPGYSKLVLSYFLKQDFVGAEALQKKLNGSIPLWARSSKVPVFAHCSWADKLVDPTNLPESIGALPKTTKRVAMLSTGHHGSPKNAYESAWSLELQTRWFAKYLKRAKEEMDLWKSFQCAELPADSSVAWNANSVWLNRDFASFPATKGAQSLLFHLRDNGILSSKAPTAAETPETIEHKLKPGFTPSSYLQTKGSIKALLAALPFSQQRYRTAPLAADLELCGRPEISLSINSAAPNLVLHVALLDEDSRGSRRYLSSGHIALRGRKPGKSTEKFPLRDLFTRVPKGRRLVLTVENLTLERYGKSVHLRFVPYFENAKIDLLHDTTDISTVKLPIRPRDHMARCGKTRLSQSSGGSVPIAIDGGAGRAGEIYVTLMSASGVTPGFVFGGETVPVQLDPWTYFSVALAGQGAFQNFVGVLGTDGKALATLRIPAGVLPKALIGTTFSFAVLSIDRSFGVDASSFSQLRIDS